MASFQERNGSYRFRFRGKQYFVTLGKVSREEAEAKASQVEYLLLRLKQELIELPPGVAVVPFPQGDGKVPVARNRVVATPQKLTLGSLRNRYLETHGNGTLEERTLGGIRLHFKHLVAALAEAFPIGDLALSDLQAYVDRRSKAKGIRGKLSPATIREEFITLRTTWNWGVKMGLVTGRFPNGGLRYPSTTAAFARSVICGRGSGTASLWPDGVDAMWRTPASVQSSVSSPAPAAPTTVSPPAPSAGSMPGQLFFDRGLCRGGPSRVGP